MEIPRTDLLAGLADDLAGRVMALGSVVPLAKGQALFDLGDAAENLYILQT